jgi:P4 family phage/plasmid primase-like protien
MKANVIFCASLEEAFTTVAMTYPDNIEQGKLARFSTSDKLGDTAGWCKLFPDGVGATFGCNREGTRFVWQKRDSNAPLPSKAERQAASAKSAKARQQAERERAVVHAAAAETAARILRDTFEIDPAHCYVARKDIKPYGARQDRDGAIVLPVYDPENALQSLQFIRSDGEKRFLQHGKMKGGRLFLGVPVNGTPLTLVEGWATGCSIHEATGDTVVICFSGSNMDDVAADLRRQYPDSPLRIAGDLDAHGKGLEYAQAAASAGAPAFVVLPAFADGRIKGDFNDLHQAEGLDAVRSQLNAKPDTSSREIAPFLEPPLSACDARDGTRDSRPLTEYGNAQRLFDANGERLRYVYDAQMWIAWDGAAWKWDDGSGVRSLAAHLSREIYTEGTGHLDGAEHFAKWARKSQELRVVKAAVALLSDFAQVRLPLACIDADHYAIGFNQARHVINLRNGTRRPAVPDDYITKSLSVESIGDATKAVRWLQFMREIFCGDEEFINWIQRFCGYLLTGSTQEQIFLFLFGHGANGKTVFIEVLKHIMGDYGRAIASESLSESKRQAGSATPDLAALIGARLVISSETEENTALAESLVKGLVSGDSMSVRMLYAAPIEFKPNFKLVMFGNHKPVVRGHDHGMWRRIRLVPFNRTFLPEEKDPQLIDTLKAEAPHILAWMVDGSIAWHEQGLADTPKPIRAATDAYQVDQDLIGRWLEECTLPSKYAETASADIYANYRAWCFDNGHKPVSSTALGRKLSERGYSPGKVSGKRAWCGLNLTDSRHASSDAYLRATGGY